ncbi:serine hydrolase domain-containing protein [Umezawaea sp. Da 62-37]|uniref:serine hydrolase domain-containing protein n=1 Tax=Umezawaea sp. Da 62-37 TaxID=3075927 RepID=UPI0028F71B9A|nr:serine hydrolase domain-containing protein [Umezawaea sp. Da 62-37]WNV87407.1 serine hydrolase domain-containing protein [Umezawaea sp. Da 62-37]
MNKAGIALLALSGMVVPQVATAAPQPRPDRAVLQRDADHLLDLGAPGVLVELTTPTGSAKVRAGYADTTARTPVPWDAHFRIGSSTKTFTATVLLQLVGEGRLSLEDAVDRWLPGVVAGNGNDGAKITVRQLLQHTSGLPEYLQAEDMAFLGSAEGFQADRFRNFTGSELVAMAMTLPPVFAPGADWSYSNTNYVLAGMIIKRITGHDWNSEVRTRIIEPLHLDDTTAPHVMPFLIGAHATGYALFAPDGPAIDATALSPSWAGAAGAIVSDTADLSTFLRALLGGRLLRPAQLAEMRKTVPATPLDPIWPGARYGLGLVWIPTSCGGYWSHGGDIPGFKTRNGVSADGRTSVVITMNGDPLVPKEGTPPPQHDHSVDIIEHAFCGTS